MLRTYICWVRYVAPMRAPLPAVAAVLGIAVAACTGGPSGIAIAPRPVPAPTLSYTPQLIPPANWPQFRRDDQRTGNNPLQSTITKANVATLKIKWQQTLCTNCASINGMFANPTIVNGVVYAADMVGYIHAYNESSGAPIWTFLGRLGSAFVGTPLYVNGVLYEGSWGAYPAHGAEFFAVSASGGQRLAQYESPIVYNSIQSSGVMLNGAIWEGFSSQAEGNGYCVTANQLVGFNSQAAQVAGVTLSPLGTSGAGIWSSPVVGLDGYLYVATGNSCSPSSTTPFPYANAIVKVSPLTKQVVWAAQTPHLAWEDFDYGATSIYVNGLVVGANKDGYVYAYQAATGAPAWTTQVGGRYDGIFASPATDGTRIYVAVNETANNPGGLCQPYQAVCGAIKALSLNGNVLWSTPTSADGNGSSTFSAPALSQGMVFVAYGDGVSALDAATGAVLWRYQTNHIIYAGPAIVDGGLFIGEFDGPNFYCFTPNGL